MKSTSANPSPVNYPVPFETACTGFNPSLRKLALMPLLLAGAMSAQAADTTAPAPAAPTPAKPAPAAGEADAKKADAGKTDDVVALPAVEVEGAKPQEISSPKFTQPIVDTPQTVVAIPQEVYAQQGATTLSDVLRNTPGITFAAGEGGSASRTGGDAFYLRGFDTSNSIYIDGVRDEGATTRDTFNIQQVDVAKGPAPDNGRGGTAGYVNLETKTPTLEAFQTGTLVYGLNGSAADNTTRATLDVNQPLKTDAVKGAAFRLNLMGQDGGVPGRQFAEKDRWGVAPSFALGLGTPTRVTLAYQHIEEHNTPDYGLPTGVLPESGAHYSPGVSPTTYYGFANIDHEDIVGDAVTARVEHDFNPDLKLSNQTRYDHTHRLVEATSPATKTTTPVGTVDLSHRITDTTNSILSNQTNLTALFDTGPFKHTLSTGLELSLETAKSPGWDTAGLPISTSIYNPDNNPNLSAYTASKNGDYNTTKTDTGALYAFDTVDFAKSWQALLGLRLEHYNINYDSVASGVLTSLHTQKTTLSWKTGLVFKPAKNGSLYATYSTSIRPPGSGSSTNTLSTSPTNADNPLLDPQEAINYEIGTKWEFLDKRLLTTLALFRSVNTNVPATDPVSGQVTQSSDQTVDGIELGVSGKITDAWLVFAGYAYMNAKVSSLIQTGATSGNNGSSLPLLPEQSGNIWTTYRLPFGLTLGGGAQYMGETARLQYNNLTMPTQVPSYWLFNAMASYEVNKHLTLRLNVVNLFDKEYIASLNNNGQRLNFGAPRTYVVSADFSF